MGLLFSDPFNLPMMFSTVPAGKGMLRASLTLVVF
jgi:hypothetical protein